MADISTELANIMSAIYGEEVRTSIHDAIQKMNTQLNSAASSTLNALGFRGDFSSGTLDQLTTENDRGIWRLLPTGNYTDYPEDYQKGRGGLLFVYVNGSYCRQELRYYKLTEGTGADSSKVWTRTLSGGEGIFSDFTDWIVEAPLSFKGDYRNGASLNALTNDADKGIYRLLASNTYSGMPSDFVQTVSGCLKVYVFGTNVVQELSYISNFNTYECISWKRVYTGSWGEWEKNTDTTLTKSGVAADAKAVGDTINGLNVPTLDTMLSIEGAAADAKAVGDKALISKQVYMPVGDNANLNNFYTQGIYSVMAPQGTQNWPFESTSGLLIVLNADNDLGTFITYAVAQIAICEGKYAFRSSVVGQSGPKYSDWVIYSLDATLSVEGTAADAKAVGDAISGAVENVVSSKGLAMSTDPEHPVKNLNEYKAPGIYYVGATRVTNWAFDDNYRGVLIVFNPMTSAVGMPDSIVQVAFSNGELAYRMFNDYGTGQTELWSDWIKNDNGRLFDIIENIADINSVQNEIEATENQNYYLERIAGTTCRVKSSTGTELVLYSVAVTAKKNYRVTASNVATIDNAILAFSTRALADNVGCTMLIDNTGGPTIDYSYSPTQDGYLFLSKGTNASMTYKIYEVEDQATLKTDKTLSEENMPADAKETGKVRDDVAKEYSASSTYNIGDYCLYENELYRCSSSISAEETWTPSHWSKVKIADELAILNTKIDYKDTEIADLPEYSHFSSTLFDFGWSLYGTGQWTPTITRIGMPETQYTDQPITIKIKQFNPELAWLVVFYNSDGSYKNWSGWQNSGSDVYTIPAESYYRISIARRKDSSDKADLHGYVSALRIYNNYKEMQSDVSVLKNEILFKNTQGIRFDPIFVGGYTNASVIRNSSSLDYRRRYKTMIIPRFIFKGSYIYADTKHLYRMRIVVRDTDQSETGTILVDNIPIPTIDSPYIFNQDGYYSIHIMMYNGSSEVVLNDAYSHITFGLYSDTPNSILVDFIGGGRTFAGPADSTLFIGEHGTSMLIDGVHPNMQGNLIREINSMGIDHLDYVMISHFHNDHFGGLTILYEDGDLSPNGTTFILPSASGVQYAIQHLSEDFSINYYNRFMSVLNNATCTIVRPVNGDVHNIGGMIVTYWNADHSIYEGVSSNYNDWSLCCYVTYGTQRICMSGDLGPIGERLNIGKMLKSNIYKSHHHGWDGTSAAEDILGMKRYMSGIMPEIIISLDGGTHDELYLLDTSPLIPWCEANAVPHYRAHENSPIRIEVTKDSYKFLTPATRYTREERVQ